MTDYKRPRPPTPKQQQKLVDRWNAHCPVGTPVTVRRDTGTVETVTTSPAQMLSGHTESPVISPQMDALLDAVRATSFRDGRTGKHTSDLFSPKAYAAYRDLRQEIAALEARVSSSPVGGAVTGMPKGVPLPYELDDPSAGDDEMPGHVATVLANHRRIIAQYPTASVPADVAALLWFDDALDVANERIAIYKSEYDLLTATVDEAVRKERERCRYIAERADNDGCGTTIAALIENVADDPCGEADWPNTPPSPRA